MTNSLTVTERSVLETLRAITRECDPIIDTDGPAGPSPESHAMARLADFAAAIADQLGVSISAEDLERLDSLEEITRYVATWIDRTPEWR